MQSRTPPKEWAAFHEVSSVIANIFAMLTVNSVKNLFFHSFVMSNLRETSGFLLSVEMISSVSDCFVVLLLAKTIMVVCSSNHKLQLAPGVSFIAAKRKSDLHTLPKSELMLGQ